MRFWLFFLYFFVFSSALAGPILELKKVSFHAPVGDYNGWIRLEKDQDALEIISEPNKTDAWVAEANAITNRPVAYVSGYQPRVSAVFDKKSGSFWSGCNAVVNPSIYVRGRWSEANLGAPPILAPKKLTDKFEYSAEPLSITFQSGVVKAYPNFTIIWEYSTNEEGPWTNIGFSFNPLYITHKTPVAIETSNMQAVPKETHFLTSVHVACTEANEANTPSDIVASIYAKFQGRCVKKVNGLKNCMEFWGPYGSTSGFGNSRSLRHFLAHEDARCGEWRRFLSDILSLHGIKDSPGVNYGSKPITVTAYSHGIYTNPQGESYETGILPNNVVTNMKNTIENYFGTLFDKDDPGNIDNQVYIVGAHGSAEIDSYFFVNNWVFDEEDKLYGLWTVNDIRFLNGHFIAGADAYGVRAQGNSNPRSYFNNHAILQHNNSYYDPSYGTGPFSNSSEWANASVAGLGVYLVYRDPNNVIHPMLWLHKKTASANHIHFH